MNVQKICIIGDGLAGLSAAIILSQENIKIDLYTGSNKKNKLKNDDRTTAISESSYQFIKKKINIKNQNIFWPSKVIKLFYEDKKNIKNFLNFEEKDKNLMYIFKNKEFKKILNKQIKKKKNIKVIKKNIKNIDHKKGGIMLKKNYFMYDLIILSIGGHSMLYNKITNGRSIQKNYKEIALTATVKHKDKITNVSQFFLNEGPLAILPFNKKMFSVVWSISNVFFQKNYKIIKKILGEKLKIVLNNPKIENIQNIQKFPINLNLKTKYFKNNILILGDGIHAIHPMAGQGFNLVLRDIKKLNDLMVKILELGLSLKNSFMLKDFYQSRKPENTIFGLGIDLTNIFFKNNKYFFPVKKIILSKINNFRFIKKISRIISDKGMIV
jgi:2-polyprenyl-6-methoxyphenol hydroxylase-like FAD-dependent oxidoreductase